MVTPGRSDHVNLNVMTTMNAAIANGIREAMIDTALANMTRMFCVDVSTVTTLIAFPREYKRRLPGVERYLPDKPRSCTDCRDPARHVCSPFRRMSTALSTGTG